MIETLLAEKIAALAPQNALEQEHVLAELMQQIALAALARAGLFTQAIFHGGTCLRLFFGMHRFSEDLDFMTKSHALLCRSYTKGRDWYDLLWFVERGVLPDLPLLESAIAQQGPWAGKFERR